MFDAPPGEFRDWRQSDIVYFVIWFAFPFEPQGHSPGAWVRLPPLSGSGRVAALVSGWCLGSQDLLRGCSLRERPHAKSGYQRPTLVAVQSAEGRNCSPGGQDPRGDGPQGTKFERQPVPG